MTLLFPYPIRIDGFENSTEDSNLLHKNPIDQFQDIVKIFQKTQADHLEDIKDAVFRIKSLTDIRWRNVRDIHHRLLILESRPAFAPQSSVLLSILTILVIVMILNIAGVKIFNRKSTSSFFNSLSGEKPPSQNSSNILEPESTYDPKQTITSRTYDDPNAELKVLKSCAQALTNQLESLNGRIRELERVNSCRCVYKGGK